MPRRALADPPPNTGAWLTKEEAAHLLGISPLTIYRWGKTGVLTEYRLGPRMLRYAEDEVRALFRREGS